MGVLRIEQVKVTRQAAAVHEPDLDHWKKLALDSSARLESQNKKIESLNAQTDELRARLHKTSQETDRLGTRVDDLTAQNVRLTADRDSLRAELASQNVLKRAVWEMAQTCKAGIDEAVAGFLAVDGSANERAGVK